MGRGHVLGAHVREMDAILETWHISREDRKWEL